VEGIGIVTETLCLLYFFVLKIHHMQNENQNVGKCMVSPLGMNSSLQFFAMS